MNTAIVTSKGQITISVEVRQAVSIDAMNKAIAARGASAR